MKNYIPVTCARVIVLFYLQEAHTMAERDLGSTLLMPQTHLYKPDRVCKFHSQFLPTSDYNTIERAFTTCLTSMEIQQTRQNMTPASYWGPGFKSGVLHGSPQSLQPSQNSSSHQTITICFHTFSIHYSLLILFLFPHLYHDICISHSVCLVKIN